MSDRPDMRCLSCGDELRLEDITGHLYSEGIEPPWERGRDRLEAALRRIAVYSIGDVVENEDKAVFDYYRAVVRAARAALGEQGSAECDDCGEIGTHNLEVEH